MVDLYDAWNYVCSLLPDELYNVRQCLHMGIAKVNPLIEDVDDNESLNTEIVVWLEFGLPGVYETVDDQWKTILDLEPWKEIPEYVYEGVLKSKYFTLPTHDPNLDCSGSTFEEAFMKLYDLLVAKYGKGESGSNGYQ